MLDLFKDVEISLAVEQNPKKTGNAWLVIFPANSLVQAAKRLHEAGFHLEDISGLDMAEGYCASYCFDRAGQTGDNGRPQGRVCLRVFVPREEPSLPSISSIFQGAEWHEQEARDFYGLFFDGHPNLIPLLMPVGATERPLRKSPEVRKPWLALFAGSDSPQDLGRIAFAAPGFLPEQIAGPPPERVPLPDAAPGSPEAAQSPRETAQGATP